MKKVQVTKAHGRKNPDPSWLNHGQMAQACGISQQAFHQWKVEPVAKIGKQVFYLAGDVVANRLANQQQKLKKHERDHRPTKPELEANLQLTRARAEWQELKNAKLREELAPVELISWVIGKAASQISAILESIPMNLKKRNPRLTASNIEFITREIVKTQNIAAHMKLDLDEYDKQHG